MELFSGRYVTESDLERLQLIILPQPLPTAEWASFVILSPDWVTGQAALFTSLNAPKEAVTGKLALFFQQQIFFFLQPFH